MAHRRAPSLSFGLALASVSSAVAVGVVCIAGLVSLRDVSRVTRNAVTKHGGRITARNRTDASGAVFQVAVPVLR